MSPGPYLNVGMFRTPISANDSTQQEELGLWRFDSGKILKYVQASGAVIPAFEAVKHDNTVTSVTLALVGNRVRQTSGATDMLLGIAETTLAANNFGWITCYGVATARVTAGEVPNTPLGPSGNTGVLSVRNTSHFQVGAIAVASGLSAGSTVFVRSL